MFTSARLPYRFAAVLVVLAGLVGLQLTARPAGGAGQPTKPSAVLHMPGTTTTEPGPQTFAPDGAWCWFGDPRADYYHATRDRVFYGWITHLGDIQIAQYDRQTHRRDVYDIAYGMRVDDHSNPSLITLPDGRLMVFWTGHAQTLPIYYRISTNAESVLSWGPTRSFATSIPGHSQYTYPDPVFVPQDGLHGRLYLLWRSGVGTAQDTAVTWSDDLGGTWAPGQLVISNPGQRPYTKVVADGRGGIDIATTDGHPDEVTVNNVYFARFYQGSLYRADGTLIRSIADGPAPPSSLDLVHSQAATGAEGWTWDISVAADGTPVITLADFPSRSAHRYRYATWSAAAGWEDRVIVADAGPAFDPDGAEPSYSGGVMLDPDNPDVVYLSRKVGSYFEIQRSVTRDQGLTWTSSPITANSTRNNVRPFVVSGTGETGAGAVLWMAGSYTRYTNFGTAIVGFTDLSETRTVSRMRSSISPGTVARGKTAVVGVRLIVDATGATIAHQPVELWVRTIGSTTWSHLANATTDASGYAGWTRRPTSNADYDIRYRGAATITASTSPRVEVLLSGTTYAEQRLHPPVFTTRD